MATKARHDVVRAYATPINALNGIPALTPEELAEFIDSPEPVDAHVEAGELDEWLVASKMIEGSSPPLGAP
jgi:hypothetical protein